MSTNKLIGFILIAVFVIMNIVGYIILPDTLVVQVNFSGEASTTMPKLLGLLVVMILGIVMSVQLVLDKPQKEYQRWYLASFIILIVNVILFVFNL